MSDKVFHLGVTQEDLNGATLAILPGDPERVKKIADQMDSPEFLASHREFTLYRAKVEGKPVIVCSTGIGGPSTSIAVEELAQLGVRSFLRVGTTGAIQPNIQIGDMIVTTGAVRLDGASLHFAPMEFPAVSDFAAMSALKQAADDEGIPVHTGITASSDTFYPGQERYDTYSGRVTRRFQGSVDEWQAMGVMNFEMESATLFTMCASSGLQAGCIGGVIINRTLKEIPDHAIIKEVEAKSIRVVVKAAALLLA
ncbi:uridine phosphorylase [Vibrio gazogenes]|uniref:Uridine phosphorylase n=3 Tax=Vibrio gazogenes TaxID=687 RepID=A0A1M5GD16_VIBGA|nr:uridine phosphorylase [Vibrio gazogenes]USP14652.1 uridine phosphorylase [Vibrio gazogenes]SHG01700.1 uridine phosphorylase [Vibrio gazogenes DSM 21264] [Vibrio gazogenes DSM 21264 = NBRC 103151]